MDAVSVIFKPILTEKANALREGKSRQYAFEVHPDANKNQIRDAVEKLFNVKTLACSVVNVRGKERTMGMGGKRATGFTASRKKAYVTLAENQKIEIFEGA